MYKIKLTNKVTNNSYYFVCFVGTGDDVKPRSCHPFSHETKATVFPSIKDACAVVKLIDPSRWRCLIRPISRIPSYG